MFESLNITSEKIWKNKKTEAMFYFALGYLNNYIYYTQCENAQPGDFFYQESIDVCIQGKEYIAKHKNKNAKLCVKNLLRLYCVNGFIKSYKIKSENGYFEDQNLIVNAFSDYVDSVRINLNGRRYFEEALKLLQD